MKLFLFYFIFLINFASANNDIKNWPWRGVNIPIDILNYEPSIIQELSNQSVNSIRIHIEFIKFIKTYNYNYEEGIEESVNQINKILDEVKKYNMTAFLGIESFPFKNKVCENKLNKVYWSTDECMEDMYILAEKYSSSFTNRGNELTGYQFMSEAVYLEKNQYILPKNWNSIQKKILQIIREKDKTHFFIYSPTLWALTDKFDNVELLNDDKIIYNAHYFFPYNYTHQGIKENEYNVNYPSFINFTYWDKTILKSRLDKFLEFRKKNNVPILIGSFSKMNWIKDDNKWLKDILEVYEENNISWLYFIVGEEPWRGWNPRYIGNYEENKFKKNEKNETWLLLEKYFKKNKEGNKNDNINN